MSKKKRKIISDAQLQIMHILNINSGSYVLATRFWDFQQVIFAPENIDGYKYFKKRTREALVLKGMIQEFEPNKLRLTEKGIDYIKSNPIKQ